LHADTAQPNPTAPPANAGYDSLNVTLPSGKIRKIFFRPGTSDVPVLHSILVHKQYDITRLRRSNELMSYLNRQRLTGRMPLIVDAGANIGAASLFFASVVPDAKIVAIEPDAENFKLLEMNVCGLPVEPIFAAVSSTDGWARVVDPAEGHWGYRTVNVLDTESGNAVPRQMIGAIYRERSAQYFPFIVKIDIEGAEADLFSANTEWVATTPILIIELHDKFIPRSANSGPFLRCVSQLNRDFISIGEDVFSIANDLN
jgi:FkbM family methyltransferase